MGNIEAKKISFWNDLKDFWSLANPLFWSVVLRVPEGSNVVVRDRPNAYHSTDVRVKDNEKVIEVPTGNSTEVVIDGRCFRVNDWRLKTTGRGGDAFVDQECTSDHFQIGDDRERVICTNPRVTAKHNLD
jgi:hypothetical protein